MQRAGPCRQEQFTRSVSRHIQILDVIAGRNPAKAHLPHLDLRPGHPVALLVNGLGATTAMELHVAARAALAHTRGSLEVKSSRMSRM